jgi:D-3-phosphoglycerate dehydrogenase
MLGLLRERTAFPRALIEKLPNLKFMVLTGARASSLDDKAATERGIPISNTPGGGSNAPTAELSWALLMSCARDLAKGERLMRTGGWHDGITQMNVLEGKRLGVLGLGRLGSRVAGYAKAFGMDVVAWSQNLTVATTDPLGVHLAPSKDELLATSDFVSIHLVLSRRTRGLLGAADLRRMKRTAYLVNTSRAPIVDAGALVQALREGWIAGAGLDVFETEPVPPDDPLRHLPNVVTTPHLGYVTEANYRTYFGEAVEDITAFLDGTPVRVL